MNKGVNILITGDTYPGGGRVKEFAARNQSQTLFGDFLPRILNSDLAITNLESPVIDSGKPIQKTGPSIKSAVNTLQILKNAGFNLVTLANNHIMDYGADGLYSTIKECEKNHLDYVGAGENLNEAKRTYYREIHGIKVGIINIAENEFGTTNDNRPGAHPLNPVQNFYTIKEAAGETDYVIVIVHGGHERYPLPSPRMKETYRFFIDSGADIVVGHHPHCYSGYERYNEALIFYSLGNFLFDTVKPNQNSWHEGFLIEFLFNKEGLRFELIPYIQNAKSVGLRSLKESEYSSFNKNISHLNTIIADDNELEKKFKEFCESSRSRYTAYIEPHSIKYLHALRNRNLFPSMLSKRKKRLLLNLTRCEAHRDVLQCLLEK